jgi:hypothetical protein
MISARPLLEQISPWISADAIDDCDGDSDRDIDYVEERDIADEGPLKDMDLEEDT